MKLYQLLILVAVIAIVIFGALWLMGRNDPSPTPIKIPDEVATTTIDTTNMAISPKG